MVIFAAVGLSLQSTRFHFEVRGDGGAIAASLVSASALAPAAHPRTPEIDAMAQGLRDASPVSATATPAPDPSRLLAELDDAPNTTQAIAGSASSAQVSSPAAASRTPSSAAAAAASSAARGSTLGPVDNPWAHASAAPLNASRVRELWAAVKPCWRGQVDEASASIRVVLGKTGEVVAMSALGGLGAGRSAAEALASAVSACAPYRLAADAYLVTGPV